jgi:hypothetical protein
MKSAKYWLVALIFFISASAFAQSNMEDVLYLKNGNVYRGMIIEQVPGVSYKIQIAGGSIFTVTLAEIEKITKEQAVPKPNTDTYDGYGMGPEFMFHHRDTSTVPYYLRKHRMFKTLEFRPGNRDISLRLTHGYKFGQFGFVGLGVGLDAVSFNNRMFDTRHLFDNTTTSNGVYIPVYIHYSGEILRKRITPYYFVEAGYGFHPNNPTKSSNGNKSWGGPTAAAGFGVKFYSKGRVNFALNLNANYRSNRYRTTTTTTDVFGVPYTYTTHGMSHRMFGAIGLAIGF